MSFRLTSGRKAKSFVVYVLVFWNKRATTLKGTALVAYPEHVMLIDVSVRVRL